MLICILIFVHSAALPPTSHHAERLLSCTKVLSQPPSLCINRHTYLFDAVVVFDLVITAVCSHLSFSLRLFSSNKEVIFQSFVFHAFVVQNVDTDEVKWDKKKLCK